MVHLYRCNGSCNTLDDICGKTCIPNKMEDASLSVFNIITGISDPKKQMLENVIQTWNEEWSLFDSKKFKKRSYVQKRLNFESQNMYL